MSVPTFGVKVLGGTFHVHALLMNGGQTPEIVRTEILATPADRWFVMVADDPASEEDTLAMIDDRLELQLYAQGVLRQD